MLTLTFDSSVLINAHEEERPTDSEKTKAAKQAAKQLLQAHKDKKIEVAFNMGEPPIKSPEAADDVVTARGPWILGVSGFSELRVSTVLADDSKAELFEKAHAALLGNVKSERTKQKRVKDFALIAYHINAGRDLFITEDNHFKKVAEALASDGVTIISAVEAVKRLRQLQIL